MTTNSKKYAILMGLLLGAGGLVSASNVLTFQVDMSVQIGDTSFNPLTDKVYVRGSFNGFPADASAGLLLTNDPAGSNPALYTGTTNDTVDANFSKLEWKFSSDAAGLSNNVNNGFETTLAGNLNRMWVLGSNTTVVLPYTFYNDAGTPNQYNATFRVNMAAAIFSGRFDTNAETVEVQGDFSNWSAGLYPLSPDPSIRTTNVNGVISSNVYVGTYPLFGSPGQMNFLKYVINNAGVLDYENTLPPNGDGTVNQNRFVLIDTNQSPQIMPLVNFADTPLTTLVTNTYVYRVNISNVRRAGIHGGIVDVRGAFNNWDNDPGYPTGVATNNPGAANTNIYYFYRTASGLANTPLGDFKFTVDTNNPPNGGGGANYENGNNRNFTIPSSNNAVIFMPVAYFGDTQIGDTMPVDTLVTFSVNMTNATAVGGYAFNSATDNVYINGVNYPPIINPAGASTPVGGLVAYGGDVAHGGINTALDPFLMTNNPVGSKIYSTTVLVPAGYNLQTRVYRYSINGTNNETTGAQGTIGHRRYIRSLGSYQMPLDTWSNLVQEVSFTNLVAGPTSGGNVPVTWTGRPGVYLQVNTNLTAGSGWQDLLGTEATSATNYPAGANKNFFRLIKPFYWPNY